MAIDGEAEEGVDGGEAGVASAYAVAPVLLQVLQESDDERCVEIPHVQPHRRLAGSLLGEAEQQAEGVAVGGHGVRAGLTLVKQTFGEERLQGGGQRAHRRSSRARWRRCPASTSNSGVADRYQ